MNSWSSIPKRIRRVVDDRLELVPDLHVLVSSRAAGPPGEASTTSAASRRGRRRGRAEPLGVTCRGLRAFVYSEALVVARYECGVESQPASGVAFSAAPSSPRVLVAFGDLPEEEVGVGPHAADRVGAQRGHRGCQSSTVSANASLPALRSSIGSRRQAGSTLKNVYANVLPGHRRKRSYLHVVSSPLRRSATARLKAGKLGLGVPSAK